MNAVSIDRPDPGVHTLTFGDGVNASDLAEAFASLPADATIDGMSVSYFCDDPDCDGQPVVAEDHTYGVQTLFLFDGSFDPDKHCDHEVLASLDFDPEESS